MSSAASTHEAHASLDVSDILNHNHPRHATMAFNTSHDLHSGNGIGTPLGFNCPVTVVSSEVDSNDSLQQQPRLTIAAIASASPDFVEQVQTRAVQRESVLTGATVGGYPPPLSPTNANIATFGPPHAADNGESLATDGIINNNKGGNQSSGSTVNKLGGGSCNKVGLDTTPRCGARQLHHYIHAGDDGAIHALLGRCISAARYYRNKFHREIGEFLAILVYITIGATLSIESRYYSYLVDEGKSTQSTLLLCAGWGMTLMAAGYLCIGTSGGHINPAVTISLAIVGKFPWHRVPGYLLAQLLGSIVGMFFAWLYTYPLLDHFDGGRRQATGPHATLGWVVMLPSSDYAPAAISMGHHFWCELFASFAFLFPTQAMMDRHMHNAWLYLPIAWGAQLTICLAAFGMSSPVCLNPMRDLGPRLFMAMAGWGSSAFSAGGYYFWVPLIAPLIGGVGQILVYKLLIYPHKLTKLPQSTSLPISILPL
ncbi:hypothetical protein EV182_003868 [Spiromyces aspiralis]|uniref:Uncharacterized protein n=1 Tax=Spiromyces aspiralis TaxID=68401 RepID=A0ACC1HQH5_9FUNG|nr:hypothetical protein EV182_003868 [Spiromyces aspiralis]